MQIVCDLICVCGWRWLGRKELEALLFLQYLVERRSKIMSVRPSVGPWDKKCGRTDGHFFTDLSLKSFIYLYIHLLMVYLNEIFCFFVISIFKSALVICWVCFFNFEHAEEQKHPYLTLLLTLLLAVSLRSQNLLEQAYFWSTSPRLSRSRTG